MCLVFRYHEDGSKKLNTCSMVYFSPEHRILSFTNRILQHLHVTRYLLQPNTLPPVTLLSYLLGDPAFLLGVQIPIHSVQGVLTTAHPLLILPPFHTPQIKLKYLHRWHQQHQPSSFDTLSLFYYMIHANVLVLFNFKLSLHCRDLSILKQQSFQDVLSLFYW